MFPLLRAIEKLGTPEQIVSALTTYSNCNDPAIRKAVLNILKKLLEKKSPELHEEIDAEVKKFIPN